MIKRIGVIYQDRNSVGFLRGLRDRLKCEAEFVEPPARIGKPRILPPKRAKLAWAYFQKQGVDLVVRFTDADRDRWQDVRRKELDVVPNQGKSIWICGVAVNNVEEWLYLDEAHLATLLRIPSADLKDSENRAGCIKSALSRLSEECGKDKSEVVARIVRDAPPEVFRRWLTDDALREFYTDCRAAATAADCETPNELDAGEDE